MNLESTRNRLCSFCNFGIVDIRNVGCILSNKGENRHQMRFTRSVVANYEYSLMVNRFIKSHLGNDLLRDALRHVIGDDIGGDELHRFIRPIGIEELNDRFNRFKLN